METPDVTRLEGTGALVEELKQAVVQYQVVWSVYPEWGPDAQWHQQKVGYDVELAGTHFQPEHPPSPGCTECTQIYDALRRIAEWILPKAECDSRYEIDDFDRRLAMSRHHGLRQDVALTIRIVHRDDYRRPIDDGEGASLAEMERNLSALGARRE
jgi:hypothetical protein